MSERKPYPSDLSDARWALIEPTPAAWRKARLDRRPTGQPDKVDLRDAFSAILCVNRTGIPWKYLPHDFPNHATVYAYYAAWRDGGIFARLDDDLTGPARVKEGRKPEPTASVTGAQSVKTSTNVPVTGQGTDAAKKIARDFSFPAERWNGPSQPMDEEARWATARRLLHDDTLKPEDRLVGLLLLLYAQWPAAISRLTVDHIEEADGAVRIRLGAVPYALKPAP